MPTCAHTSICQISLFQPIYKARTPAIATIPAKPAEITPVGMLAPPELELVLLDVAAAPAPAPVALAPDVVARPVMLAPPAAPPIVPLAAVPLRPPAIVAFPVAATSVPLLARVDATVPLT